jgi:chromosome segregation and condensation protein ScpB
MGTQLLRHGWEHLAHAALGRHHYDAAAKQAVHRAIDELLHAGLIKHAGRRRGDRQSPVMYELTL